MCNNIAIQDITTHATPTALNVDYLMIDTTTKKVYRKSVPSLGQVYVYSFNSGDETNDTITPLSIVDVTIPANSPVGDYKVTASFMWKMQNTSDEILVNVDDGTTDMINLDLVSPSVIKRSNFSQSVVYSYSGTAAKIITLYLTSSSAGVGSTITDTFLDVKLIATN
jgi:hypothetical protein